MLQENQKGKRGPCEGGALAGLDLYGRLGYKAIEKQQT
jgi:hypothetical protein